MLERLTINLEAILIHRKRDVRFGGIKPELVLAIIIAADVYRHYKEDFRFTSCVDGQHGIVSYHKHGYALDFNLPQAESVQVNLVRDLVQRLGPEFDVVVESDHIHVEFDVRRQGEMQ